MSKPMLMYISHGHGQDNDPGAVSGKFEEREMAVKVAKACYEYLLKQKKRKYKIAYPERKMGLFGLHLFQDNRNAKDYSKKYRVVSVDIHFNAGKGDGMEVWIPSNTFSEELARLIGIEFKKIGQNFHGNLIKRDDSLMFLHNAGVPVLVECGFVDNVTDRKLFDTDAELRKMGEAIAKGLIKYAEKYA